MMSLNCQIIDENCKKLIMLEFSNFRMRFLIMDHSDIRRLEIYAIFASELTLQVQLKKSGGQVKMWDLTTVFVVFLIFTVGNANSSPKGRNGKH